MGAGAMRLVYPGETHEPRLDLVERAQRRTLIGWMVDHVELGRRSWTLGRDNVPECGRSGFGIGGLAPTLCLLIGLMGASPALSDDIVIGTDLYDDLFVEIETSCSAQQSREIAKKSSVTNLPIVFNGSLGAIGKVGTSHGIGPLRSGSKTIGLILSYYERLDRCDTFLFFKTPLPSSSVKISSAFPKDRFPVAASREERTAFEQLLQSCIAMGSNAPSEFADGGYVAVDGDIVDMDGGFDCESAAIRNSSVTKFVLESVRVRISIFGGKIYIVGK